MKLQPTMRNTLSIILFLAMAFLTVPIVRAQTNGDIAFASQRDGDVEIYVMNANGTNQTNLTNNSAYDDSPSLSADGSKIAFHAIRFGNSEIYVMNANGTNQINVTNNSADDSSPSFSPDGSKIAFISDRDGNEEIYVMDANGSNLNRLTNNSAADSQPSFSPDGSRIAFSSNRDGSYEIYVMDANGTNETNVTNNSAFDADPSFSPDGGKIAFSSQRDGNSEIYVMDANGSNLNRLTNHPAADIQPSWGGEATPPTLSNVAVTTPINEGGTATLSGNINDSNAGDTFTLTVNWGDGSALQFFNYPAGTTSFSETHQYLDDNPNVTSSDNYTINYQIVDNNGTGEAGQTVVTVNNVNPIISNLAVNPSTVTVGSTATLTGDYTDPGYHGGFQDESLTVFIDWGDGASGFLTTTGAPGGFLQTHQYSAAGNYTITVKVTDNDSGETVQTVGISVVPPPPPAAPSNLKVDTVGKSQVSFSWTDNANNESGFVIEQCRNKNCGNAVQVGQTGANVTTYTDTGLFANTQYYYRVRAVNLGGSSAYSNTVTAKTLRK